jgi:hypothetical protein
MRRRWLLLQAAIAPRRGLRRPPHFLKSTNVRTVCPFVDDEGHHHCLLTETVRVS